MWRLLIFEDTVNRTHEGPIGGCTLPEEHDYRIATLIQDTIAVLAYLANKHPTLSLVVMGHSMGGAVAAKAVREVLANPVLYPWHKQLKGSSSFNM